MSVICICGTKKERLQSRDTYLAREKGGRVVAVYEDEAVREKVP